MIQNCQNDESKSWLDSKLNQFKMSGRGKGMKGQHMQVLYTVTVSRWNKMFVFVASRLKLMFELHILRKHVR